MKLWLFGLLFLLPLSVQAQPPLRVGILSKHAPHSLVVEGAKLELELEGPDGRRSPLPSTKRLALRCMAGSGVIVQGRMGIRLYVIDKSKNTLTVSADGRLKRRYKGRLEITGNKGVCSSVVESNFEDYVESVACAELGAKAPAEALRAQAVVVRGYAVFNRGKHAEEGFDFCDLTHCQVFTGEGACSESQKKTLAQVRGQVLLYEGKPAEVVFFSTCAGHTASAQDVWGRSSDQPYLQGVKDGSPRAHCAASDHWRWRFERGTEDVCRRLEKEFSDLGTGPCSIKVAEEGQGGWVRWVEVEGQGRRRLSGARFHMLMGRWYGWSAFKSGRFKVETRGDRFVFLGRGLGHGVGLCQHGAMGMARQGDTASESLSHYFPGTSLGAIP